MTFDSLFRLKSTERIRKVVIVGNGAIQGGNEKVAEAIQSYKSQDAVIHAQLDYGTALAFYAANIRTIKNVLIQRLLQNDKQYNIDIAEYRKSLCDAEIIREKLATAFSIKTGHGIELRPEISRYVPDLDGDAVGVITINWDELLWQEIGLNLVQLHGRTSIPNSIILPMEQIQDAFISDIVKCTQLSAETQKDVEMILRGEIQYHLRDAERQAFLWMHSADELVVYGVSMNPYDAELFQLMRQWNNFAPKDHNARRKNEHPNLTIINPDPLHVQRTALFLCAQEYRWIDPLSGAIREVRHVGRVNARTN